MALLVNDIPHCFVVFLNDWLKWKSYDVSTFLFHFTACSHNENWREKKEHLWSSANYWEIWERTFLEWMGFRSSSKHLCPQWCCSFHLPALCCCGVPAGPCQVRLIFIKELSCKKQQNMAAWLLSQISGEILPGVFDLEANGKESWMRCYFSKAIVWF